jgi:hypothetical protein
LGDRSSLNNTIELKLSVGDKFGMHRRDVRKLTAITRNIPKTLKAGLDKSNETLNDQFSKLGVNYEGTDPIPDAAKSFRKIHNRNLKNRNEKIFIEDVCSLKEIRLTDPFETFGHGIVTYFSTLIGMIVAMSFMVACFIPVMHIYSQGGFLKDGFNTGTFDKIGIANLG